MVHIPYSIATIGVLATLFCIVYNDFMCMKANDCIYVCIHSPYMYVPYSTYTPFNSPVYIKITHAYGGLRTYMRPVGLPHASIADQSSPDTIASCMLVIYTRQHDSRVLAVSA